MIGSVFWIVIALTFNDPLYLLVLYTPLLLLSLKAFGKAILVRLKGASLLILLALITWPFIMGSSVLYVFEFPSALIQMLRNAIPSIDFSFLQYIPSFKLVFFEEGTLYAFAMSLRILILLTSILPVMMSTSDVEFVTGLVKLGLPYKQAYSIIIALTNVPSMIDIVQTVSAAQRARGLDIEELGFFQKIKRYAEILPPLVSISLNRSFKLAMAMDSLAFGAKPKRTFLRARDLQFKLKDYAYTVLIIAVSAICIYLRLRGYGVVIPYVL